MNDKKTKMFFKLLRKQRKVFNGLQLNKHCTPEERQMAAFCLTELHYRSQRVVRLTKKISETNLKFTKNDLDSLLGNLIDLRTEIYVEILDWIKELKKPLNVIIDEVGKLGGDESGANAARKVIRSSMKQIDVNMKRIKYYSARNKRKNKSQHE